MIGSLSTVALLSRTTAVVVALGMKDTGCVIEPISSGYFTASISPEGELMGEPLRAGDGVVIAE